MAVDSKEVKKMHGTTIVVDPNGDDIDLARPRLSGAQIKVRHPEGHAGMICVGYLERADPGGKSTQERVWAYPYMKNGGYHMKHETYDEQSKKSSQLSQEARGAMIYADPLLNPIHFHGSEAMARWTSTAERKDHYRIWLLIVWRMCTGGALPDGNKDKKPATKSHSKRESSVEGYRATKKVRSSKKTSRKAPEDDLDLNSPLPFMSPSGAMSKPKKLKKTPLKGSEEDLVTTEPPGEMSEELDLDPSKAFRNLFKPYDEGRLGKTIYDGYLRNLIEMGKEAGKSIPRSRKTLLKAYTELKEDETLMAVRFTPTWQAWEQRHADPDGAALQQKPEGDEKPKEDKKPTEDEKPKEDGDPKEDDQYQAAMAYLKKAKDMDQNDPEVAERWEEAAKIVRASMGIPEWPSSESELNLSDD